MDYNNDLSYFVIENKSRQVVLVGSDFCMFFAIDKSPTDFTGRNISNLFESMSQIVKDRALFFKQLNAARTDMSVSSDNTICLMDGRLLNFNVSTAGYFNDQLCYMWQFTDITKEGINNHIDFLNSNISSTLIKAMTQVQVERCVLDAALKIDQVYAVGIYMLDTNKSNFVCKRVKGRPVHPINKRKEYQINDDGYSGLVFGGECHVLMFDDLLKDQENLPKNCQSALQIYPIIRNESIIGALNVEIYNIGKFSEQLCNLIELIVKQTGSSFERIDIHQKNVDSQRDYEKMFNTVDDFVFVLDIKGNIVQANPYVLKKLDFSFEELAQVSFREFVLSSKQLGIFEKESSFPQEKTIVCQTFLITKLGQVIPVEIKISRGWWNQEKAFYCIARDISKRLKIENDLRSSEAYWQMALDSSGDGIWEYESNQKEIFFSKGWIKGVLGYDIDGNRMKVDDWLKYMHSDDLDTVTSIYQDFINEKSSHFRMEFRVRCEDGAYKWLLLRGKSIVFLGSENSKRVIGTVTDISMRKSYEVSLSKSLEKERELNELKSKFVTMASHEFRSPLSAILISVDTMEAYMNQMTHVDIQSKIKRIKGNILFLTEVLDKIMDLSNIERGEIKFQPVKTNVYAFFGDIINTYECDPLLSHIIDSNITENSLLIEIDKHMMKQVIKNIVGNSFKYSPVGSTVRIWIEEDASKFFIHVQDNGIGIEKEDADKVFLPFNRGINVGNIRGTGLGLSLSLQFVRYHGGDIFVESEPHVKTVFTIMLPKRS
ncbi:PAS domain-containing sensor histidine kinase [uncultured Sunxiuqinia sp.]|uniref:PAS domain-containing sensor histidine kinase n=1 Tax=uncultured Sunxiuqinia sp. TaxID=1573825 RepID=UPI002AA8FA92|nr:PAS domain-containing sensor histidine kinase [uncultured Sunxiuqinia sp.]